MSNGKELFYHSGDDFSPILCYIQATITPPREYVTNTYQ